MSAWSGIRPHAGPERITIAGPRTCPDGSQHERHETGSRTVGLIAPGCRSTPCSDGHGPVVPSVAWLFALSAGTGHTEWQAPGPGTLAHDGRDIFTLAQGGTLTAYTASTGRKLWAVQLPRQGDFTAPPTTYDGVVYASGACVGGSVYAVSEADGRVRWMEPVQNGAGSSPAVDDSGIYVSYSDHRDYRFSLSGEPAWQYAPSGEGGAGSTPVLCGGSVSTRGDPPSTHRSSSRRHPGN